jgi:hypothetical protein
MAPPPSPPRGPEHANGETLDGDAREASPEERYGPLALRRLHKDDGRLLIVFRDAGEQT